MAGVIQGADLKDSLRPGHPRFICAQETGSYVHGTFESSLRVPTSVDGKKNELANILRVQAEHAGAALPNQDALSVSLDDRVLKQKLLAFFAQSGNGNGTLSVYRLDRYRIQVYVVFTKSLSSGITSELRISAIYQ